MYMTRMLGIVSPPPAVTGNHVHHNQSFVNSFALRGLQVALHFFSVILTQAKLTCVLYVGPGADDFCGLCSTDNPDACIEVQNGERGVDWR
jgi:hypothetical protein